MANYLNFVALAYPRNATTTTTADPANAGSVATVLAGATFTPTAGRFLLCIMEGAVTSTTPTGWALPTNGSAVNNTGLYVWYRTAAGADTISSTHNGSNYPIVVTFIEYASGAAFVKAASAIAGSAYTVANPALTGLTGTNDLWAVKAGDMASGYAMTGSTWSGTPTPTQLVTTSVPFATTDGYYFNLANAPGSTAASWTPTDTITGSNLISPEMLTFAISYPTGGTNYTGTPSEAVGVTDATVSAVSAARSVPDPVGVTDTVTASFGPQANPLEAVGITDTIVVARSAGVTVSDGIGITDTGGPIQLAFDYTVTDPVGVTDAAVDVAATVQQPADTAGVTDIATSTVGAVRSMADPVGLTDTVTTSISSPGDYTAAPADMVGVTDAVLAQLDRVVTVADLLSLTDTAAPTVGPAAALADPVGVTDVVARVAASSRTLPETVGVVDTVVAVLARAVTLADPVGVADAVTGQSNLQVRDLTLTATPLPPRWGTTPSPGRWSTSREPS